MSFRKPITFSISSFGGYKYKLFNRYWWDGVFWYLTGISWLQYETPRITTPGWCQDVYAFYHRGRYGWAPRDTWNLSDYYADVFAGSLEYLAEHHHGCPPDYYDEYNKEQECHQWATTLRRWATAFSESPNDVSIFDRDADYAAHNAEEIRRRDNLHAALKEVAAQWEHLWD